MRQRRSVQPVRITDARVARAANDRLRHARLFELLRQQSLAERALLRLHRRASDAGSVPSPVILAASLVDHASVRSS
jgi:hypothetical protein